MTHKPGKIKDNWIVQELTAERERQQLSLQAVGDRIGVSKMAVSYWEHGAHSPTIENVILWAVALGFHLELTKPEGP